MFCYQCEQTAKGEGCTKSGVCGKQPDVAALQDLLLYAVKGLSLYAFEVGKTGIFDSQMDRFVCEAIFSTLTNVDFDPQRFVPMINRAVEYREALKSSVSAVALEGPATFVPEKTMKGLLAQGERAGVKSDPTLDPDILSLQQLLIYVIKGLAAYADYAAILGQSDDKVFDFIYEAMATTLKKNPHVNDLVGMVLKCGEIN
ncbi:MAG: hydroxylamine reductase, partial [Thermodesulfobacteriota bacterium]|nr:hydroxylamine reductase [Thermodesulfobacteriota bacterium]